MLLLHESFPKGSALNTEARPTDRPTDNNQQQTKTNQQDRREICLRDIKPSAIAEMFQL
jgi:hypothetical protein